MLGRPVILMFVGDDDGFDVLQVRQGEGAKEPGSMIRVSAFEFEAEAGMFMFGDAHGPSRRPGRRRGKWKTGSLSGFVVGAAEHGIIERLRERPHRIVA